MISLGFAASILLVVKSILCVSGVVPRIIPDPISLVVSEEPQPYTWTEAVPPRAGNWPRWVRPVAGFNGNLVAVDTVGTPKRFGSTSDGVSWTYREFQAGWGERYLASVVFFRGKLWVLGGRVGPVMQQDFRNDVWSSPDGVQWTRITQRAPWAPRAGHTALVYRGRLWVIGGGYNRAADDIWSTPDGVTWTRASSAPQWSPRSSRSFVVFDDRIWAIGFQSGSDIWSTTDGARWTQASANAGWPADRWRTAAVFDAQIWALGGFDEAGRFYNDVWQSADGVRWSRVHAHAPWFPRAADNHADFAGRLWIYGGKNSPDDVWYLSSATSAESDR